MDSHTEEKESGNLQAEEPVDRRYVIEDTLIRKKTDEWLLSESHQILVLLTKCNILGVIFPLGSSVALISQHYTDWCPLCKKKEHAILKERKNPKVSYKHYSSFFKWLRMKSCGIKISWRGTA